MQGYFGNDDATAMTIDEEGWLHTGDMGRIDHNDRLFLVGRSKEVVVSSSGENIYLDDVEAVLGTLPLIEEYVLVGLTDPRGGERLGMLAKAKVGRGHAEARRAILDEVAKLPAHQRPSVVQLVDAPLPRTATRKIQRKDSRKILEKIIAAKPRQKRGEDVSAPVARAIAAVAGVQASVLHMDTNLAEAHGFDSLMWVELASALDELAPAGIDPDVLSRCETVADVVKLVDAPPVDRVEHDNVPRPVVVPSAIANAMKQGMGVLQKTLNGAILRTKVTGRSNIPQNRSAIVVCNHTSHLDMGLVKYALGPYGEKMTALAARDYFFEGNRWKVAYFEHLTNVTPLDRKAGFRTSLRQAIDVVNEGKIVLIFPEGTRQMSGQLGEFKPLIGKIALDAGVDILPLHIDGAYNALPKGSAVLKSREIHVRIGPPIRIGDARRLTAELKSSDAARKVAHLAHMAVERLSQGTILDVSRMGLEEAEGAVQEPILTPEEQVTKALESLSKRFDTDRLDRPLSWYFSLGELKYSVAVNEDGCVVRPGRPASGAADCVVKASPELIRRLICESYVPTPSEFVSGAIKTNDIPLLIEFSRVFDLTDVQG